MYIGRIGAKSHWSRDTMALCTTSELILALSSACNNQHGGGAYGAIDWFNTDFLVIICYQICMEFWLAKYWIDNRLDEVNY
jgi:hypothetical protein